MTADPPIPVLAAVVRRGDRLLVCRRPAHKRHGGLWEFPGGKLEPGETAFDAARRELREELDVEVLAVGDAELEVADPGSPFVIAFHPVEISGEPRALEHDEVRFVGLAELLDLPLAPSDRQFAMQLAAATPRER